MNFFKQIGELLWPTLEPKGISKTPLNNEIRIENEDVKSIAVNLALKMYDDQRDRIKNIESKSIVFIGFFASIIAIITFLIRDAFNVENLLILWLMIICSIIIIYASRVIHFTIKALERKSYSTLDETVLSGQNKDLIIQSIVTIVKSNHSVINEKVDYMTMAQEYVKRIIYSFVFLALLIMANCIVKILLLYELNIPSFIMKINSNNYSMLVLFALCMVLIVWNIILSIIVKQIKSEI